MHARDAPQQSGTTWSRDGATRFRHGGALSRHRGTCGRAELGLTPDPQNMLRTRIPGALPAITILFLWYTIYGDIQGCQGSARPVISSATRPSDIASELLSGAGSTLRFTLNLLRFKRCELFERRGAKPRSQRLRTCQSPRRDPSQRSTMAVSCGYDICERRCSVRDRRSRGK